MSVRAKDGAYVSVTRVVRLECTCGYVSVSRWPMNDSEEDEAVKAHLRQHGGEDRG